jgi:hypothetical protein
MTQLLIDALIVDRDEFAFYGREHRAKLVPGMAPEAVAATMAKAERNENHASRIDAAIAEHLRTADVTALERIQDYRFGSLVKGKHYAFARGLTINPTHLPAALDAMQADGFTLVSIFGQTDAQSIGFIFRIDGPNPRVDELLAANTALVLANRELRAAMREFVERVDRGEVRSTRTYAKFKALLGEEVQ